MFCVKNGGSIFEKLRSYDTARRSFLPNSRKTVGCHVRLLYLLLVVH